MVKRYMAAYWGAATTDIPVWFAIPSFLLGVLFDLVPEMPDIAAYSFYAIFGIALIIMSPYWAYKKLAIENDGLRVQLKPKIRIIRPVISSAQIGPSVPVGKPIDYIFANYVHVIIENDCGIQINNCSVELISLRKYIPEKRIGAVNVLAPISNRIPLVTSGEHLRTVTISPGLPAHFDLIYTRSDSNK